MLRTIIILGLLLVIGSAVLGFVLGMAGMLLLFLIKVAILGGVVYLGIRIVSPRTAEALRAKFGRTSLPRL